MQNVVHSYRIYTSLLFINCIITYIYMHIYFLFCNYSLCLHPFPWICTVAFYSNNKYFPLPTLQPNKLSAILSSYLVWVSIMHAIIYTLRTKNLLPCTKKNVQINKKTLYYYIVPKNNFKSNIQKCKSFNVDI